MKSDELLYEIFEQHLLSDFGEDVALQPFVDTVVHNYMETLTREGYIIPIYIRANLEEELSEEVLSMTRKKTYGFLSLKDYRDHRKNNSGRGV